MRDPERLLKSGAADPAVRELLGSLRELAPEPRAGLQSWGAMAAKVAALPTVVPAPTALAPPVAPLAALASGTASQVAPTLARAFGGKLAAGLVISACLGAAGFWYRAQHGAPNHTLNPPHSTVAAAPALSVAPLIPDAPSAPAVSVAAPLAVAAVSPPLTSAAPSSASGTRVSRLDAEAQLVATVRRQLRGGDPRAALTTLTQLQNQFPNGELRQERDVLSVEALAASGNTAAAKSKASAFIAAHPASPLSPKLERLVQAR